MPYKTIAEIKSISNKLCLENGLTPSDIQRGTDTKIATSLRLNLTLSRLHYVNNFKIIRSNYFKIKHN